MPALDRKDKVTCGNCGTSVTKYHLSRHRCALRALIIASAERLKSFVQAKFTQTLCIWTIHFPNENNSAIVIPTIRGECATHCNCSQKCHTCKQQKIDSCRDV